jgi:hypothetical protein
VAGSAARDAETGVWKSGGGGLEFWKVSARWSSHRLTFVALAAGGAGRTVWLVKIFSTDVGHAPSGSMRILILLAFSAPGAAGTTAFGVQVAPKEADKLTILNRRSRWHAST